MAIDTRRKRQSVARHATLVPDGVIGTQDRRHAARRYAGFTAGEFRFALGVADSRPLGSVYDVRPAAGVADARPVTTVYEED